MNEERNPDLKSLHSGNPEEIARVEGVVHYLKQIGMRMDELGQVETSVPDKTPSFRLPSTGLSSNQLPESIGRFQISGLIGEGGFARVLLATDPRLSRQVAIKLPRPEVIASEESKIRFQREAQAAAVLNHPNIVAVYEVDEIGPIQFIASEYIAGCTLGEWLESHQQPIDPRLTAEIIQALADAVEHAHQRGIVHRDLKPANILVSSDSDSDFSSRLKITDFGLAKFEAADQFATVDGAIIGTPVFMSPEQARGEQPVTKASDVYSLGVILYQLLTGALPHKSDSNLGVLQAIQSKEPEPPRKIRRDIPNDLETICLKCLNKDPDDRYGSAFDLSRDLENWLAGRPILAIRPSAWKKFKLWTRRNQALATSLALLFVTLLGGFGLSTWKWIESNKNYDRAVVEEKKSKQNLNLAQSVVDDLVRSIVRNPHSNDESREMAASRLVDLQDKLLASAPNDASTIHATAHAYFNLAEVQSEMGRYDEASTKMKYARELMDRYDGDTSVKTEMIQKISSRQHRIALLGNQREQEIETAEIENRSPAEWLQLATEQSIRGDNAWRDKKFPEAIKEYRKGLGQIKDLDSSNPFVADMRYRLLTGIAYSNVKLDKLDEADVNLKAAFEHYDVMVERMGSEHPFVEEHYANGQRVLGHLRTKQGKWNEAIDALRTSNKIQTKFLLKNLKTRKHFNQIQYTTEPLIDALKGAASDEDVIQAELDKLFELYLKIDQSLRQLDNLQPVFVNSAVQRAQHLLDEQEYDLLRNFLGTVDAVIEEYDATGDDNPEKDGDVAAAKAALEEIKAKLPDKD